MKILVVDDSSIFCDIVKLTLTKAHHEVITAADGISGVHEARENIPDLILLDILMPRMNGYEACKILKRDESTKHIPIFILSTKGQIQDMDKAFQAGADNYIIKPIDPKKLNNIISYKLAKLDK